MDWFGFIEIAYLNKSCYTYVEIFLYLISDRDDLAYIMEGRGRYIKVGYICALHEG